MKVTVRKHENCVPNAEAMCTCCTEIDPTALDSLELELLIEFFEMNFVKSIDPDDDIDYVIIMMNAFQKLRSAYEMMMESEGCCE